LAANTDWRVAEMDEWNGSSWVWRFKWRRQLWDTELQQVSDLYASISEVVLCADMKDRWIWKHDVKGTYKTKSCSYVLDPVLLGSDWNLWPLQRLKLLSG
jgi:hypothetical protein